MVSYHERMLMIMYLLFIATRPHREEAVGVRAEMPCSDSSGSAATLQQVTLPPTLKVPKKRDTTISKCPGGPKSSSQAVRKVGPQLRLPSHHSRAPLVPPPSGTYFC